MNDHLGTYAVGGLRGNRTESVHERARCIQLASEVEHEAEAVLVGPFDVQIPPGRHTQSGECVLQQEQTVFAIFPHMHQYGTHFKATFVQGDEAHVVHDDAYFFEEQYQLPLEEPMLLTPGDRLVTECTWENTTNNTILFGESSDREMCFNVVFQYPARGQALCGVRGSGASSGLPGPPCGDPDDAGNALGVGRHCTAGGGECGGSAALCLADFASGDPANFCTMQCTRHEQCGDDALCSGRVCYPVACQGTFGGAGGN
jgi:hypothetical protein